MRGSAFGCIDEGFTELFDFLCLFAFSVTGCPDGFFTEGFEKFTNRRAVEFISFEVALELAEVLVDDLRAPELFLLRYCK